MHYQTEFATFSNLVLKKTRLVLTNHPEDGRDSPDGKHNNHIDDILLTKRFRSGVNIHRTRSFLTDDIGSDHDLVMMTFRERQKKVRKPSQLIRRFDLEKLRGPDVANIFQPTICGEFVRFIGLRADDMDTDTMNTTYNTALTDAASEILGKELRKKKKWNTTGILNHYDETHLKNGTYLGSKVKLMRSLVISLFLYTSESWVLTAVLEKK